MRIGAGSSSTSAGSVAVSAGASTSATVGGVVSIAGGASASGAGGYNYGHVRVYTYNGGSWNQLGQDIDGEGSNDGFGGAVSLSSDGNTVAIGAEHNDNAGGTNAGQNMPMEIERINPLEELPEGKTSGQNMPMQIEQ